MPNEENSLTSDAPDTSRGRPDIVVIGAMRAGTTTLQQLLATLPGVSVPAMKETDFFISDRFGTDSGWDWYTNQFDAREPFWCDISPNYGKRDLHPNTAKKIASKNPNAMIIFIARDPIERAISQYNHSFHMGQQLPDPAEMTETPNGRHVLSTSKYAYNLDPFYEHFPGRVAVLDFARLKQDPKLFLQDFIAATGIDADIDRVSISATNTRDELALQPKWWGRLRESALGEALRRHLPRNQALQLKRFVSRQWGQEKPRDVPQFSEDDRARMIDALADDIARFRTRTGQDFSDWCL